MEATAIRAPLITARSIGKSYGGVSVLRDVDLDLTPGEVHCLVGENGAGKSTLLKILGGAIRADRGTLSFDGTTVSIDSPRSSIAQGVSLISQEGALVPARSVLENTFLAHWSSRAGIHTVGADRRRFDELLARTGFTIDPSVRVDRLSIGEQQQVEILRSLARGARVIAMDEPTAVLAESEKHNLLALIRRLASAGVTVILVSHFLDEVLSVADRISVLRDGALVVTDSAANHDAASLVRHMVGRDLDVLYPEPPPVPSDAPVRLAARGLSNAHVHDFDLEVRAGEILGIAGLVGSGRTEALRLLFGADRATSGIVEIDGHAQHHHGPRHRMAAGMALVPESRKEQGLVMVRSVRENVAFASLGTRRVGPFVRRSEERTAVDQVSQTVGVRAALRDVAIQSLSGGNQQKALFAKWLIRKPRVLLIDEPTRGIDIAAKGQLHTLITQMAAAGMAVVCVSSDLEELLALSHRVMVFRHGRTVAEFGRGAPREAIIAAAFGDQGETA